MATDRLLDPEVPAEQKLRLQIDMAAYLYAFQLGIPRSEYQETANALIERNIPDQEPNTFPLFVETRIPWPRLAEISGIDLSNYLRLRLARPKDWQISPETTQATPLITLALDGTKFVGMTPVQVAQDIPEPKRGGTFFDAVALWHAYPEFARNYPLELIGSRISEQSNYVPIFSHSGGYPWFGLHKIDYPYSNFRPLVCTKT